jgi:hypothetical protein
MDRGSGFLFDWAAMLTRRIEINSVVAMVMLSVVAAVSYVAGDSRRDRFEREAIDRGYARKAYNRRTGQMQFVWSEIAPSGCPDWRLTATLNPDLAIRE